jgi:tight adherence protein B
MAQGMLPIAIAGLAAFAVLLIAVGIAMSGGSGGVAARLDRYTRQGADQASGTGDTAQRESVVTAGLTRLVERQGMTARLSTELARADLKLKPAEFVAAWIASPFVFMGAAYVLGFVFAGFGNPIALALMFAVGLYAPRFYLKYRQGKRLKAFSDQLPDTITLLANSLRAGSSFLQGIELVTRESQPPISEEFERVVREMSLGVALQPALNNLVRRVDSEDLELMVTAINIQSQVGGNLATVLDSIAYTIRERIRIQGEIKTLTAMQRYSGYVITLLPVGLAGILFLISPTYITKMLQPKPELFGLPAGIVFFIIGGISMGIGYMLIRRIVDIKV